MMNSANCLIYTKTAYYKNTIHPEKLYLMRSNYATSSFLREHEFLFVKNNIDYILNNLSKILKKYKHNPNLCFEQTYLFFENFMPSFLDGFFGMFMDCHILRTDDDFFDKAYFLQNIKKETNAWPNHYNKSIINQCILQDFPKYVLLKNNTLNDYFFIRFGWLKFLKEFLQAFITHPNITSKERKNIKNTAINKLKNRNLAPSIVNEWIDYEFFVLILYSYIRYAYFDNWNKWQSCNY